MSKCFHRWSCAECNWIHRNERYAAEQIPECKSCSMPFIVIKLESAGHQFNKISRRFIGEITHVD